MRVPAVAIGASHTALDVAVFGYGEFGQAVAALLAAAGHRVHALGPVHLTGQICDIHTQHNAHYTSKFHYESGGNIRQTLRNFGLTIVAVDGTEYGAMCEDLVDGLNSGQSILIVGAAFAAGFEVAQRLQSRKRDLSVNIIEVDCPFESFDISAAGVQITGLKSQIALAGRSLNETRNGLAIGGQLFNGLVPASNVFERAFGNTNGWLQTAAILFESFVPSGTNPAGLITAQTVIKSSKGLSSGKSVYKDGDALSSILTALHAEVQSLAKAYGVSRVPAAKVLETMQLSKLTLKRELGRRVIEEFVILSSLARMVHLTLPVLESVIELSSVVTGMDLRKEGRQLEDLGFIGMDAHEIIEDISA